ncbi:MAG: hypothetical protein HYZ75_06110 [Elusimicrobia bacterium]|nr:hypothetical protein [Elusimicrobiota bacterium]
MRPAAILLAALVSSGCVSTYRDFPAARVGQPPAARKEGRLRYYLDRFPILPFAGGKDALHDVFRDWTPFGESERVFEKGPPLEGLFVVVQAEWKPLTGSAAVFGYLSLASLTLLPAWTGREGYLVHYHLFRDGEKVKTFSYEITRKALLWAPAVLFTWANLLTYSEYQAFEATAQQFFRDAFLINGGSGSAAPRAARAAGPG